MASSVPALGTFSPRLEPLPGEPVLLTGVERIRPATGATDDGTGRPGRRRHDQVTHARAARVAGIVRLEIDFGGFRGDRPGKRFAGRKEPLPGLHVADEAMPELRPLHDAVAPGAHAAVLSRRRHAVRASTVARFAQGREQYRRRRRCARDASVMTPGQPGAVQGFMCGPPVSRRGPGGAMGASIIGSSLRVGNRQHSVDVPAGKASAAMCSRSDRFK